MERVYIKAFSGDIHVIETEINKFLAHVEYVNLKVNLETTFNFSTYTLVYKEKEEGK